MAYGTVKVDNITFDNGGSDQNVTVSGLYRATTSGVTVTGTISGAVLVGTTTVSGATVTGNVVQGTTVQGISGSFTSLTGTTTSGTTATFVSGVFTTQVSGTTVTGATSNFTSGNFATLSGATATFTSGVIASGTATNPSLSFVGDPNTGIYSPGADQVAISTNGAQRMSINSAGNVITTGTFVDPAITGTILEDVFTITDGADFEVDPGNGSIQLITLGANRTPKATNFAAGESITLMVDDGSAYTLTWTDATWGTSGVEWTGGAAPDLATTGFTVLQFWKVGTQVYGALVGEVA
jgi:hypothetical protein